MKQRHDAKESIIHIDGDSFFASCEVSLNPRLKGKPVVIGQERGIASAMTYEAKARGVTRGMPMWEIKKVCPDVIILPSDYETYAMISQRMYEIVRRYTPDIEEYSIDECFADIYGCDAMLGMSYADIARSIKRDLYRELGVTFSVGLSSTKVLAKAASKYKKPDGLTIINAVDIPQYLATIPIEKVWGIGASTSTHLLKKGVHTALDFITRNHDWVVEHCAKPYVEIWYELQGIRVNSVSSASRPEYKSISKTRTFTPPSSNKNFVFAQLSKNIENACIKARRHGLVAGALSCFIKTHDFKYYTFDADLVHHMAVPHEMLKVIKKYFDDIFDVHLLYRASGVTLLNMRSSSIEQQDLFRKTEELRDASKIYNALDMISLKYGKHSIFLGTSFKAHVEVQHEGFRGKKTARKNNLLRGESYRRRINIPSMGYAC